MDTLTHEQILGIALTVLAIVAGGIGWALSKVYGATGSALTVINSIRADHVTRSDHEVLWAEVRRIAQVQSAIQSDMKNVKSVAAKLDGEVGVLRERLAGLSQREDRREEHRC